MRFKEKKPSDHGACLHFAYRRYGLGIDNVLQFEVVLANGSKVVTDQCSEPDLFWALRGGGGGTFGVVTAAVYRLHPKEDLVQLEFGLRVDGTPLCWQCRMSSPPLLAS